MIKRRTNFTTSLLVAGWLVWADHAAAFDQAVISAGTVDSGRVDAQVYRVGVRDYWQEPWWENANSLLGSYWELDFGYFDADEDNLSDVGISAALRWQSKRPWAAYAEIGSGAHFFSHTRLEGRSLSTALQFGSWLGVGMTFGERKRYELGYRYVHYSNAGIKRPNDGLDAHLLHVGWRF